jgi:Gpi18-like mannosyltransferase
VVVNASMYGQCDSIWVAFCLGGVYYLLKNHQYRGVALIAVAIAFKPQGVFILPVLLLLVLAGKTKARTLLALPVVYVALDLPAILLGRSPGELLTIYTQQLDDSDRLARSGPSVYHYLPVTVGTDILRDFGYLFTIVLVLGVCYVLVVTKTELDATRVLTAAACFAILVPFLLPGMHERYFYLADVLTVVLAFYLPRLWYLPLLIQASSALAYAPFLFRGGPQGTFVDIKVLATMMLAGILVSGYALLHDVRSKSVEVFVPAQREQKQEEPVPVNL